MIRSLFCLCHIENTENFKFKKQRNKKIFFHYFMPLIWIEQSIKIKFSNIFLFYVIDWIYSNLIYYINLVIIHLRKEYV